MGELWPEVGDMLDLLVCAGRPLRFAPIEYARLRGRNWLTHDQAPPSQYPSLLVRDAVGIPAHDLRTVAADWLRRASPERAAEVVAALLGHRTARSGEAYRALCAGETGAAEWSRIRADLVGAD